MPSRPPSRCAASRKLRTAGGRCDCRSAPQRPGRHDPRRMVLGLRSPEVAPPTGPSPLRGSAVPRPVRPSAVRCRPHPSPSRGARCSHSTAPTSRPCASPATTGRPRRRQGSPTPEQSGSAPRTSRPCAAHPARGRLSLRLPTWAIFMIGQGISGDEDPIPTHAPREGPVNTSGPAAIKHRLSRARRSSYWWARTVSNRRHLLCKSSALPLSYAPVDEATAYMPHRPWSQTVPVRRWATPGRRGHGAGGWWGTGVIPTPRTAGGRIPGARGGRIR